MTEPPERQRLLDEAVKEARLAAATGTDPDWIEETLGWVQQ